ncbi:MAG: TetR family transcriptional regulator, partial [Desulfurivibrionaceae bacterium]
MATSEKRQEILHAALELIAEHGFHGAPIASIADRAGVGAG